MSEEHCNWDKDGMCVICGNYNKDYNEDADFDQEKIKIKVGGRITYIEKKWLERAKALLHEQGVGVVEEAYKVAELLEVEMRRWPFDNIVADIMVVALRETEDERKTMALAVSTMDEIVHEKEVSSCSPKQ